MAEKGLNTLSRLVFRMVIAAVLTGSIAAYFVSGLDNTYQARVLLNLAPMPFEEAQEIPMNLANMGAPSMYVSFLQVKMLDALAMPDYELLFTSEAIAEKLRERLRSRYEETGIDPEKLTVESVRRAMDMQSKVLLKGYNSVEYQQVVELFFTAEHPQLAADIANEWAALGIQLAQQMRTAGRDGAVELIQEQLDAAWEKYDAEQEALEAAERDANPDLLRQRAAGIAEAISAGALRQAERNAGMARLEAELAALDAKVSSEAAAKLAGMKAEIETAARSLDQLAAEAGALHGELAKATRKRDRAQLRVRSQERRIDELNLVLQAMELATADRVAEFKLASQAISPEEKAAPNRVLIVLVAVFLAMALVPVHLFGMIALRRYTKNIQAELTP